MSSAASALVKLSSNSSPASRHSVSRADRWAAVIGPSPVLSSVPPSDVLMRVCRSMLQGNSKTNANPERGGTQARRVPPRLFLRKDALPDNAEDWRYEHHADIWRGVGLETGNVPTCDSRNDKDVGTRYPPARPSSAWQRGRRAGRAASTVTGLRGLHLGWTATCCRHLRACAIHLKHADRAETAREMPATAGVAAKHPVRMILGLGTPDAVSRTERTG